MRWCALFALCACNRILGLGDVRDRDIDAQKFDAPPPNRRCPPVGAGVPAYGDSLHQVLGVENCASYIRANDGSAMGRCSTATTPTYDVETALPGQPLTPIVYAGDAGYAIQEARLGLGGGFAAFVTIYSDAEVTNRRVVTARYDASTNTWLQQDILPVVPSPNLALLTPTAGPQPHVAYVDLDPMTFAYTFYELAYDGTAWTEQAHYALATLGIDALADTIAMTSDGLHVVAAAAVAVTRKPMFTDRASITDHFGPARAMDGIPMEAADLFITDDCGELYFSAINRTLYFNEN